jgi:hypothetical protein
LAIFRDRRPIGRILLGACHQATGRMRFARTPDRGAAAAILLSVQPIRDNLLDSALAQGKPVLIAAAAPQGCGLAGRIHGSPSFPGRSLVHESARRLVIIGTSCSLILSTPTSTSSAPSPTSTPTGTTSRCGNLAAAMATAAIVALRHMDTSKNDGWTKSTLRSGFIARTSSLPVRRVKGDKSPQVVHSNLCER